MRFNVELTLDKESIPKDKNRIFISLLKHNFNSYNEAYYLEQYGAEENKSKSFTFALYMGKCKFLKDEIIIPDRKIILNFSTWDTADAIMFYNSFLQKRGSKFPIKDNNLTIKRISLNKEKVIRDNEAVFKTMSPISAREHKGDNKKTWYHSLNENKGQEILLNNLKHQLLDNFGENSIKDIEEVEFRLLQNQEVKVKHYGIEVLGNICRFKLKAKPYILDYVYKSGLGSQRNSGFGMLDLV